MRYRKPSTVSIQIKEKGDKNIRKERDGAPIAEQPHTIPHTAGRRIGMGLATNANERPTQRCVSATTAVKKDTCRRIAQSRRKPMQPAMQTEDHSINEEMDPVEMDPVEVDLVETMTQ